MRCERSTIGLAGEIALITEWQMPTHSLPRPKSLRKTIWRAARDTAASMVRDPSPRKADRRRVSVVAQPGIPGRVDQALRRPRLDAQWASPRRLVRARAP